MFSDEFPADFSPRVKPHQVRSFPKNIKICINIFAYSFRAKRP